VHCGRVCVWSCIDHITVGGVDRRIPSLREVYEQFPEVPINIDIKVDNDDLIRKVRCYVFLLVITLMV